MPNKPIGPNEPNGQGPGGFGPTGTPAPYTGTPVSYTGTPAQHTSAPTGPMGAASVVPRSKGRALLAAVAAVVVLAATRIAVVLLHDKGAVSYTHL